MLPLLADENLERRLVDWLREKGHDVLWVMEDARGDLDERHALRASQLGRVLVTYDLDFGKLFVEGAAPGGVILIRPGRLNTGQLIARLETIWTDVTAWAPSCLVTVEENRVRIRTPEG